jgi:hypothetical protein
MIRNPAIALALCAALMFPTASGAQVVSDKARASRLDEIARVVDSPAVDIDAALKDCRDPFCAVMQPRHVQPKLSGGPSSAQGNGDVSDALADARAILKAVAAQLRPVGLMTGVSRSFIVAGDGSIYEVGKPFKIEVNKQTVEVIVEEAGDQTYVLRRGTEKLKATYEEDTEDAGSATNSKK